MNIRSLGAGFVFGAILFSCLSIAIAWTGPASAPPNGNVSAPINTGTTDQVKSGGLSVDTLAVFGNGTLTGNFGINNATPTYRLDVGGTMRVTSTGDFTQADPLSSRTVRFGYESTGTEYGRILKYGSAHATLPGRMLIDNMSAGSNATGGYIDFRPESNFMIIYPSGSTTGYLRLYGGGSERLRVAANGDVTVYQRLCLGTDCISSWPTPSAATPAGTVGGGCTGTGTAWGVASGCSTAACSPSTVSGSCTAGYTARQTGTASIKCSSGNCGCGWTGNQSLGTIVYLASYHSAPMICVKN
ncbi:hypothetical protein JNK62_03795 [bacterium]|nr:hypothetical protein [bacterium]